MFFDEIGGIIKPREEDGYIVTEKGSILFILKRGKKLLCIFFFPS